MKVVIITEAFGGIATYSEFLLQELNVIEGIETREIWLLYPENYQEKDIIKFVPKNRTILNVPCSNCFKDLLITTIRQDPSEIIHFQYDLSIFPSQNHFLELLTEIQRQTSKKVIITLHSIYTDPPFLKMLNDCQMISNAFIVHQKNAKNFLISKGMDPSKITIIPHGSPIIRPNSSKIHFFKTNLFKVAMMGFIKRTKAFKETISSLITKDDLEIIVAGMVKEFEVIRQIEQLKQKAKATLTLIPRFLTDREFMSIMEEANCIILPYEQDYFSSSGILHFAAGMKKIVLVSPSPKFKEITKRIPFCNVKNGNYLERIEILQNSSETVNQVKKEMASFARDTSWSISAKKTFHLYQNVLRNQ
ncbi:MAG: hypothetical protein ACFFB5_21770 [Promethearchaeota archaeon]